MPREKKSGDSPLRRLLVALADVGETPAVRAWARRLMRGDVQRKVKRNKRPAKAAVT